MSTLTQFFSMGGGGGMTGQAFTAPGTWTSPSSATAATFYAVGGGGGGGFTVGGGGGATKILTKVISPSTGYTATIGAGGPGSVLPGMGGFTLFNNVYGDAGQGGDISNAFRGYGGGAVQIEAPGGWSMSRGAIGLGMGLSGGPGLISPADAGGPSFAKRGSPLSTSGGGSWGEGGSGGSATNNSGGGGGAGFNGGPGYAQVIW
jgi:hypothetical protein